MGTQTFNLVARIAEYAPKKEGRAIKNCGDRLPNDVDHWDEVRLIKTASPPVALYLLGDADINLTPYGAAFSAFSITLPSGKRRLHHNVMHGGFEPRCEKLRDFFVGMECMIRYGCAITGIIATEKASTTEPLSRNQVRDFCTQCGATEVIPLVHLLLDARNSFCHSLLSCDRIRYNDQPLNLCFSKSHFYRNHQAYDVDDGEIATMRFFDEDAFTASEALIVAYRKIQHRQLDVKVLSQAVTAFLTDC
jgi:hypothetical protein